MSDLFNVVVRAVRIEIEFFSDTSICLDVDFLVTTIGGLKGSSESVGTSLRGLVGAQEPKTKKNPDMSPKNFVGVAGDVGVRDKVILSELQDRLFTDLVRGADGNDSRVENIKVSWCCRWCDVLSC